MKNGGNEFDWLAEFDCSEREQIDDWSALSASERAEIERLDAEVCGLLPCMLEPLAPSSQCREKLMRRLAVPSLAAHRPTLEHQRSAPRWLLPLAAGLTAVAVGFAASMVSTVRDQRDELAALRVEVEELSRAASTSSDLATGLAAARENLALMSGRGVGICALRPTAAASGAEAYGVLFVAADHQHWYVRVQGLEPAPDRYYRVWFETEEGLVGAGNLLGEELELSSPTMPEGTRAIHVSLETEPAPAAPSDRILLFGDDMVQVL